MTKPKPEQEDFGEKEEAKTTKKTPSLLMALVKTFGAYYSSVGVILIGQDVATLINPLILK